MKKYLFVSLMAILLLIQVLAKTNAFAIEEFRLAEGKSMYIKKDHLSNNFICSSSNNEVLEVSNGLLFGKKAGNANVIFIDGAHQEVFKINVTDAESVKWLYTIPNNPQQGSKITLVAITNKFVQDLEFIIETPGGRKIIKADERIDDGKNFIYKGSTFADSPGTLKLSTNILNPKAAANYETNIMINKKYCDNSTPKQFRASDAYIAYIEKKEGFASKLNEDPLARKTFDVGFGGVVNPKSPFYNNINRQEAHATLLNLTNNGSYAKAVNSFLLNNNIVANQHQFDAFLSFTYNTGAGWTMNLKLPSMFKDTSFVDIGMVNSKDGLRFRSAPSLSSTPIRSLRFGEEVQILESSGTCADWLKVSTKDGKVGFCYKKFITIKKQKPKSIINLNDIDKDIFINEFLKYHHAGGGKCIKGLLNRRIEELQMFFFNDYSTDGCRNKHAFPLPNCYINSLVK